MSQQSTGLIPNHVVAESLSEIAGHLALHLDTLEALDEDGRINGTLKKLSDLSIRLSTIGQLVQRSAVCAPEPTAAELARGTLRPGEVPPWAPGDLGNREPEEEDDPPPSQFARVRSRSARPAFQTGGV